MARMEIESDWHGLYLNQLSSRCFSPEGKSIFLSSTRGSTTDVIRISLATGDVQVCDWGMGQKNHELIAAVDGGLIVSHSAPFHPPVVSFSTYAYHAPAVQSPSSKDHPRVGNVDVVESAAPQASGIVLLELPPMTITTEVDPHTLIPDQVGVVREFILQGDDVGGGTHAFTAFVLLPQGVASPPLIVVPHGGPHSASLKAYQPSCGFLCAHGGYALLFVNYRGSVGFGRDAGW